MAKRVIGFILLFIGLQASSVEEKCRDAKSLPSGTTSLVDLLATPNVETYKGTGSLKKGVKVIQKVNGAPMYTFVRQIPRDMMSLAQLTTNLVYPGDVIETDLLDCQFDDDYYYIHKVGVARTQVCYNVKQAAESPEAPLISLQNDRIGGELDKIPAYFESMAFVGKGGFGKVRKMITVDGKEVALKKSTLDRIPLQEVMVTRAFSRSKHGSSFKGCLIHGEDIYLATGMLTQALDKPNYRASLLAKPAEERLGLYIELVAGVAEFVATGYVHNDLKPDNIMLDAQGTPHLIDFGGAALIDGEDSGVGTNPFISPLRRSKPGNQVSSDIYSLACTILSMESPIGDAIFQIDIKSGSQVDVKTYPKLPQNDPDHHFEKIVISTFSDKWGPYQPEVKDYSKMNLTTLMMNIIVNLDEDITLPILYSQLQRIQQVAKKGGDIKNLQRRII